MYTKRDGGGYYDKDVTSSSTESLTPSILSLLKFIIRVVGVSHKIKSSLTEKED